MKPWLSYSRISFHISLALVNKLTNYFLGLIIWFFFSNCASHEEKPHPPCSAETNMTFDDFIQSTPITIVYQNSSCDDVTSLYGPENNKVFFLQIKDDVYYHNPLYKNDERYFVSKNNAMITYKKISGKPVVIFESSMFGAIYAFTQEGMPEISAITYPKGYISKNAEIIAEIADNKIILKVMQDIPNIGDYGLYTLKKDSKIEIDFNN
jgi:hypothetical protein